MKIGGTLPWGKLSMVPLGLDTVELTKLELTWINDLLFGLESGIMFMLIIAILLYP